MTRQKSEELSSKVDNIIENYNLIRNTVIPKLGNTQNYHQANNMVSDVEVCLRVELDSLLNQFSDIDDAMKSLLELKTSFKECQDTPQSSINHIKRICELATFVSNSADKLSKHAKAWSKLC